MFREAVLAFMGVRDKAADGCDKKQKAKCKLEFGKHIEWACKNCELATDKRR